MPPSQRHVRVYHLLKQELTKKLTPSVKWISSIAVHPGGDNLILGSYDKRLCWFDMDLSTSPYKTMRSHQVAVRAVGFEEGQPAMNVSLALPLNEKKPRKLKSNRKEERVYMPILATKAGPPAAAFRVSTTTAPPPAAASNGLETLYEA